MANGQPAGPSRFRTQEKLPNTGGVMFKRMIVLASLPVAAVAIWLASFASCQAGSGAVGLPSSVVAPAASGSEEIAQADEEQPEEESCEAHWPGCPCPKDLSGLITPPEGMALASGSCSMQSGSISLGSFTFTGNLTLKGAVVFYGDEMTDHLVFLPDALPASSRKYTPEQWRQFAGALALRSLRINEWENFGLPELSEKSPCMEAAAVIKVNEIEALIGGTDEQGNWLRKYQVVKIGKFLKCKRAMP